MTRNSNTPKERKSYFYSECKNRIDKNEKKNKELAVQVLRITLLFYEINICFETKTNFIDFDKNPFSICVLNFIIYKMQG